MSEAEDWFTLRLAEAHYAGKAPHGPELPASMPWVGDIFVKEEPDGTDSMYVWQGGWTLGCKGLTRPPKAGVSS